MALMTQPTQAHLGKFSLKLRLTLRLKRFLKRTIGGTRLYQAIRVAYSWYTKPKRQVSGELRVETHRAKKQATQARLEQEQGEWSRQTPSSPLSLTQALTPEPPVTLPLCGGSPVQVQYPGQFAGYQPIIKRPDITDVLTQRGGRRTVRLQHLIEPEELPDAVKPTAEHDLFLLDQPVQADPDATVKREAIKKVS